nr:hypothetical protein [Tanacetum cinerariifolium]
MQALTDRKKVVITEDSIRQALRLDDADGVDCLSNEEIFTELARIGYEKPSTKSKFYKAFFSAQWNLVRNVDNPSKFLMYPRFLQLMINGQIADLSSHNTKRIHPNRGREIAKLDTDEDVTLEEVDAEVIMDADVQGRLEESQAKVYHLNLEHAEKVLTMQDTNEAEPAEVEEVIEVVTAAKLMTEVVTTAATTISAAQVPKASAPRRRRGVIIQDLEEAATASVIVQSEVKSKGILVEEPKPLKRQAQIEEDLEMLWKLIQEGFQSSEPKNFSDDFLLNTLKVMFEKLNVEASIWRDQRGRYGLAKVKSWKLFESCRVHVIGIAEVGEKTAARRI